MRGDAHVDFDNTGGLLRVSMVQSTGMQCGSQSIDQGQIQIVRLEGGNETVVAYLPWRCGSGSNGDVAFAVGDAAVGNLRFDSKRGRVLLPLRSYCAGLDCEYAGPPGPTWLASIHGFTTDYEIVQTYESPERVSFRVPRAPEGFGTVYWFDTYWGELGNVGDWARLHPLQCAYPPGQPAVGQYIAAGTVRKLTQGNV